MNPKAAPISSIDGRGEEIGSVNGEVVLLLGGLALSLFLAVGGSSIEDNLRIRTPGMLASHLLIHPTSIEQRFEAVGEALTMQMSVDWVFWFGVMYLGYFVVTRFRRRLKGRR
jgi:hypothetical protein